MNDDDKQLTLDQAIARIVYPPKRDRTKKTWEDEMAESVGAVAGGVMAVFILLFFLLILFFS